MARKYRNLHREIAGINGTLRAGGTLHVARRNTGMAVSTVSTAGSRKMRYPSIGIYAGKGSSHSWLWFVDMFEKMGFLDLVFLDETAVQKNQLNGLDVMVLSGGDTFAVARSLQKQGADHIKAFVEAGGLYIGSCAGAYLPMNSSKSPLDLFNFVDVKITNLSKTLPEATASTCKFCICYGCDYIFHPVREEVCLRTHDARFSAPMYGGPGMTGTAPQHVLARYDGFTKKTSFLTDVDTATRTLIGKAAVVRLPKGRGVFHLFGPHLEHPRFPEANKFAADLLLWDTSTDENWPPSKKNQETTGGRGLITGKKVRSFVRDIKRELSNSRIVAAGMEFLPIGWLIGEKYYEPAKIRVFLESMWKRIKPLDKLTSLMLGPEDASRIVSYATRTTTTLREIRQRVDEKQDTLALAVQTFDLLHQLCMAFFELYFHNISKPHIK